MRVLVIVNKQISAELFWYLHLFLTSMDTFEMNYRQSWKDTLDAAKNGDSEVVMLNIFVGNESMAVPLLFDRSDATMNSDAETFKQLCMWYSWMQYKRGFGELVLPRRLARVDKVKVSIPYFDFEFELRRLLNMRRYATCPTSTPCWASA